MFCKFCSAEIADDSIYCDVCNNSLVDDVYADEYALQEDLYTQQYGEYAEEYYDEYTDEYCDEYPQEYLQLPDGVYDEAFDAVPSESSAVRPKKKRKLLVRLVAAVLVFVTVFGIVRSTIFFIDYHQFMFVHQDELGNRDKDALIGGYIDAVINDNYFERFSLSLLYFIVEDKADDYTFKDKVIMRKLDAATSLNVPDGEIGFRNHIYTMLGTESYTCKYRIEMGESGEISYIKDALSELDIDADDIEKTENYFIEIVFTGDNGNEYVCDMYLEIIRISRVWYVYTASVNEGGAYYGM